MDEIELNDAEQAAADIAWAQLAEEGDIPVFPPAPDAESVRAVGSG